MPNLQDQLDIFRINFRYTKIFVLDDAIVYNVVPKFRNDMVKEADELIQLFGLSLLDVAHETSSLFKDTIIIKQK